MTTCGEEGGRCFAFHFFVYRLGSFALLFGVIVS